VIATRKRTINRCPVDQENGGKHKRQAANEAFAAGRLSGREETRIVPVLKDAERAYARFAKARPFWR
jgi:hypothetical protein